MEEEEGKRRMRAGLEDKVVQERDHRKKRSKSY